MKELSSSIYIKLIKKNALWIIIAVSITLIASIILNYVFGSPPKQFYKTKIVINTGGAVLANKAPVKIPIGQAEQKAIEEAAEKEFGISKSGFEIKWSSLSEYNIQLDISAPNNEQLEKYSSSVSNLINDKIKKTYLIDPKSKVNDLNQRYSEYILNPDKSIEKQKLSGVATDLKKSEVLKPDELKAGQKRIEELENEIKVANSNLEAIDQDKSMLEASINDYSQKIQENQRSIDETKLRLESLNSKIKDSTQNSDFISKQILFLEQDASIYDYYDNFYKQAKLQDENRLNQANGLNEKIKKQVKLLKGQVTELKPDVDKLLGEHNAQLDILRALNNIVSDNEIINTKIVSEISKAEQVNNIDIRPRKVIVSAWLMFLLMCCFAFGKEYFLAGKNLDKK
ncbi:MAG: hypothetical protein N2645_09970 [Clostridia bacterium]|nr:hypothetical protein [Clostridia bacterium]